MTNEYRGRGLRGLAGLSLTAMTLWIGARAEAQWLPAGSSAGPIYYKGGSVGIGTATPGLTAEIANGGGPYNLYLSGWAPGLFLGGTSGIVPNVGAQAATGLLGFATASGNYLGGTGVGDLLVGTQSFQTGNSNAIRFLIPYNDSGSYQMAMSLLRNGYVGIGNASPSSQLHVFGMGQATQTAFSTTGSTGGTLYLQDAGGAPYNGGALVFGAGQGAFAAIKGLITNGAGNTTGDLSIATRLSTANSTLTNALYIQGFTGNVGIGTTAPQYPLSVNGIIQAKEVLVNTGWSDYVFDPKYRLTPLSDVAAYVAANHHLPEIPSAADVAEKGISVGEMQAKLLAKIEELTLHMIREDYRNSRLEDENRELRRRMEQLEDSGKKADRE